MIAGLGFISTTASTGNKYIKASANGKYVELLQEIKCPSDAVKYGNYNDYGYWKGGAWCGQTGLEGYWVWLKPKWYVWGRLTSR